MLWGVCPAEGKMLQEYLTDSYLQSTSERPRIIVSRMQVQFFCGRSMG